MRDGRVEGSACSWAMYASYVLSYRRQELTRWCFASIVTLKDNTPMVVALCLPAFEKAGLLSRTAGARPRRGRRLTLDRHPFSLTGRS